MSNIEKYQKYFTKEYLMGPNSFRLLDELIRRRPEGVCFNRTLDLGCRYAAGLSHREVWGRKNRRPELYGVISDRNHI